MREILFRGKRISNGSWVEGGIVKTFHPNFDHESPEAFNFRKANCYCICANNMDTFVEQKSIGQFTGLTDKNDKKIFEGDILNGMGGLHAVYYDTSLACFEWAKICGNWSESFSGWASEYEVIGNIHDNPELLKGDKSDA